MINASQKDSLKGGHNWVLSRPTTYIMLIDHQPITPENIMDLHII